MENQFVTIEIAKDVRILGFNAPCFAYYNEDSNPSINSEFEFVDSGGVVENGGIIGGVTAPLWQQVIDWFREKHNMHICLDLHDASIGSYTFSVYQCQSNAPNILTQETYLTYGQARLCGIIKAIELIKNK